MTIEQPDTPLSVVLSCSGHAVGKMRNELDVHFVAPFQEQYALATDEGAFHGGENSAPPPLALFIGGLTGCLMTQLRAFAKRMKVTIDDLHVETRVEWTWTPKGRIYETAPKSFDIEITLESPDSVEAQTALVRAAQLGCFLEQTLAQKNTVRHRLATADGLIELD